MSHKSPRVDSLNPQEYPPTRLNVKDFIKRLNFDELEKIELKE